VKEKCNVKCPNCGHIFDSNADGVFWWSADENGHPTVENIRCPECNAGTEPLWRCEYCPAGIAKKCTLEDMCPPCNVWSFDSFITFDESGAQDNIVSCQNSKQHAKLDMPPTVANNRSGVEIGASPAAQSSVCGTVGQNAPQLGRVID
jgi:hypothetical protein